MIKVLIMCKQLENAKKIMNHIVCKIDNLKLIGIANNFSEAKSLLMDNEADVIITTNPKLIGFIKTEFITYTPGIIIIDNIPRILDNYPKFLLINNENDFETITDKIRFFLKNAIEKSQKEKVSKILLELGFNFNWSGTIYLQDSILYAHSYKGSYSFERVKRDIYSQVADYNNTTSDRVKWSIERAIKYMFKLQTKQSYAKMEDLLKIKYPAKPGAKHLISVLANTLDTMK